MTIVNKTANYAKEHPFIVGAQVLSPALWVIPLAAPTALGFFGFSPIGIVAGSPAALWQASMPLVKAGSLLSRFQSAAMGGRALWELRAAAGSVAAAVGGVTALSALFSPSEMEDIFRKFYRKGYVTPKL
jgi:hypothetical protein